jgi:pSer/pThr/pTyr-binding forkhead associated (FHA) protein
VPRLVLVDPGNGSQRRGLSVDLVGPAGIGRGRDNLVVLDDEFVSAHHARVEPRDGSWWVADLGSTNGTLLNDRPIQRASPLRPGDVIGVGGARLTLMPREGAE